MGVENEGKAIPTELKIGPKNSRRLWLPGFLDNWLLEVLSALLTGRLYTPCKTLLSHVSQRLNRSREVVRSEGLGQ
jgi:hypothetical protein